MTAFLELDKLCYFSSNKEWNSIKICLILIMSFRYTQKDKKKP